MTSLRFSREDLSANRLGQFSDTQQAARHHRHAQDDAELNSCFVFFVPVFAFIGLFMPGPFHANILFWGAGAVLIGAVWTFIQLSSKQDMQQASINSVTGPLRKSLSVSGDITLYQLSIWNTTLTVPNEVYEAFSQGWVYSLYYTSTSTLLSAEYISDETFDTAPTRYLRWAFDFGQKDLEANRSGTLSERQRRILRERGADGCTLNLFVLLVALLMGTVSAWWPTMGSRLMVFALLGVIALACLSLLRDRRVWQQGRIEHIQGRSARPDANTIMIGTRTFSVGAAASVVVPGELYTVYYVPLKTLRGQPRDLVTAIEHHPQ